MPSHWCHLHQQSYKVKLNDSVENSTSSWTWRKNFYHRAPWNANLNAEISPANRKINTQKNFVRYDRVHLECVLQWDNNNKHYKWNESTGGAQNKIIRMSVGMNRIFELNIEQRLYDTEEHDALAANVLWHINWNVIPTTPVSTVCRFSGHYTTKHEIAFHFRWTFARVLCVEYAASTEYE